MPGLANFPCDYCGEADSAARGNVHAYIDECVLMHPMCFTRYQQDQRRPASREE